MWVFSPPTRAAPTIFSYFCTLSPRRVCSSSFRGENPLPGETPWKKGFFPPLLPPLGGGPPKRNSDWVPPPPPFPPKSVQNKGKVHGFQNPGKSWAPLFLAPPGPRGIFPMGGPQAPWAQSPNFRTSRGPKYFQLPQDTQLSWSPNGRNNPSSIKDVSKCFGSSVNFVFVTRPRRTSN